MEEKNARSANNYKHEKKNTELKMVNAWPSV